MALDESVDKLEKLHSNGITAFMDPKVLQNLNHHGDIKIDYIRREDTAGYMISVGDSNCASGGCDGCGSKED